MTNYSEEFQKYFKENIEPFNQKMLEQEKKRHELFLESHNSHTERLYERHHTTNIQLIALVGVIFAGVIVFANSEQISIWLVYALCSLLVSLIFGVWSLSIMIQASYDLHNMDYRSEVRNHKWNRKLWNDKTIDQTKKILERNIEKDEDAFKKRVHYKIL